MAITPELNELFREFPAFICIVDELDKKIVYANNAALETLGDDIAGKGIDSVNNGNTLLLTAGEKVGKRFEYNSCINGDWYWISHYPSRIEEASYHVFTGVCYGKLKNFDGLISAGGDASSSAMAILEKQISDYRKGVALSFSVCYADINGMKAVNEVLGREAGDECIKTVARVIKGAIRQTDIFTRAEGDEFLVIFPKCAYVIVDNIMNTVVNRLNIINTEENEKFDYSISYGILEVDNLELADSEIIIALLKQRMRAMKEANPRDPFVRK